MTTCPSENLEEDESVPVRIAELKFARAPLRFGHLDVVVEHAHDLEFVVEGIRIINRDAEAQPAARSVLEVSRLLAVHVEPDVIAPDAGVILGILLVPEIDFEAEAIDVESDRLLDMSHVEDGYRWTKSRWSHES